MEIGKIGKGEVIVSEENTADRAGSGLLPVYATPNMVALIENTASRSVAGDLEEGQGTVGLHIEVEHLQPTPIGRKITCQTVLTEIDRKKLIFKAEVYDETGLVGRGIHHRFIIDNKKFMEKASKR